MAKITIAGDSIVVTSSKTLDAIKDLEKYCPKALRLFEDGKLNEVFRVASGAVGVINGNGAVFASTTHDQNKYASITMPIPAGTADAKEYAAEKIGRAVAKLNKVEEQFEEAIKAVAEEKAAILQTITVVG